MSNRPETGNMKFGDDHVGCFIRGDNAFAYALSLKQLLDQSETSVASVYLQSLYELLTNTDERVEDQEIQQMKEFRKCKK